MLHKTLEAKTTATTELGEFTALAAAYTVDRMNERIIPGAFKGTIERWQGSGKQIPLRWDHSGDAANIIGTVDPSSMQETGDGLQVKGRLDIDDSEVAREAWRSMKKNRIGLSFGYLVTEDGKGTDGVRELKAVDLFEVSITPAPANPDTRFIDMKSATANPAKDHIWQEWADKHVVEDPEREGDDETSETDNKALEEAASEEPAEKPAKHAAQDTLRTRYDELMVDLSTRGIEPSEPPKVEEKPTDDPPTLEEFRRKHYDLTLEILTLE